PALGRTLRQVDRSRSSAADSTRFQAEELQGIPAEKSRPGFLREVSQGLDQLAGHVLAQGEGVIGSKDNTVSAEQAEQRPQGVGVMYQRIDIEPAEVVPRTALVVHGT